MVARLYKLEAFWGGRDEPLLTEATRLANFLSAAADSDERPEPWFVARGAELTPLGRAEPVRELATALALGRRSWLYGSREMSEHLLQLSNARSRPYSMRVTFACGLPKSEVGIWFPNRLEMELWAPREGLSTREALEALFESACVQLEPTWACLGASTFPLQDLEQKLTGVPKVSWLTYLSASYPLPSAVLEPITLQRLPATVGAIIRATPAWFDPRNPEHCDAVEQVRTTLLAAGALIPATQPLP